jgi:hypothetical protein
MKYIIAIATILIMFTPVLLWAQIGGSSSLPGDPGVPIDGGVTLLAGAAVAYGVRKLKKRKQDRK